MNQPFSTLDESRFPIKEAAVTFDTPQGDVPTDYKLIVREDTNKILSCMTNSYKVIDNSTLLDAALPKLQEMGAILQETNIFGEGARCQWKFRFPDIKVKVDEGDYVNPTVHIKNSYDGFYEASAVAGAYRLICSNGLVIGYTFGKSSARHHIGSKKIEIDSIITDVIESVVNIMETDFPNLVDTKIKKKHIADLLTSFPSQYMDTAIQKMMGKPPKTYWDLLNVATWVATHQMDRKKEATHKFESDIYKTINNMATIARA